MELFHFFEPAKYSQGNSSLLPVRETLQWQIDVFNDVEDWSKIENYDIVLIGLTEERGTPNVGVETGSASIRNCFSDLSRVNKVKIADLGDLKKGTEHKDTLKGLELVLEALLHFKVLPVLLGGGNELVYSAVAAFARHKKRLSLTLVDPRLDIVSEKGKFTAYNYLNFLIRDHLDSIYNVSNIGLQGYYNSSKALKLFEDLYFDIHQLGNARRNINDLEPVFRDSDIVAFDISSIKQSDAPSHTMPSVNGFYSEEACQLVKYAGLSDQLRLFGIFEHNPKCDVARQGSLLVAQLCWHFFEGVSQRQNDFPTMNAKHYTKFIVQIEDAEQELVFYKNTKNGRWWAEIPYGGAKRVRKRLVSCTENDYQLAAQNQIPDLWWKTLQKLNQRKV